MYIQRKSIKKGWTDCSSKPDIDNALYGDLLK